MSNLFKEIGIRCSSDRIHTHGYHRFYPIFFKPFQNKNINIFEIGVLEKEYMDIWFEYFPKSLVYGMDINNHYKYPRGEVFQGNQSDPDQLDAISMLIGEKMDIIVDDGSHNPEHQLFTFNHWFLDFLIPGGLYIIEDIETSYWTRGNLYGNDIKYGYKHPDSIIEIFKYVIDFSVNKQFMEHKQFNILGQKTTDQIGMITFAHNCIIIVKKDDEYIEYDQQEYRFNENLLE